MPHLSRFIKPGQPSKAAAPPSGADWVHEIKHDGYRLMVCRDGDRVRCFTKNGRDWTPPYFSQNKPSPSSDVLAPPARTYEANQPPLTPDSWKSLFAELLPASGG